MTFEFGRLNVTPPFLHHFSGHWIAPLRTAFQFQQLQYIRKIEILEQRGEC